jgi:signal transduction histidine kinase
MLYSFLVENKSGILDMTEKKTLALAGLRPSSEQLKRGLPIFYDQLLVVLKAQSMDPPPHGNVDSQAMINAAIGNDEPAMAVASGNTDEICLAKSAGGHGVELLRLGYTLSHVVHAYGAMCQSITEFATEKKTKITASEFHDLNRCLDAAIAGAVTEFQDLRNTQVSSREVEHLGFLAHELRNALGSVTMSLAIIKDGTVGFNGSVGKVLDRGLLRIGELVDRSLTEVRLRVDPKIYTEHIDLLQLVDQIVVTASLEAKEKKQTLEITIEEDLSIEADQQLIYSAVSNLVQNAIKYTRRGGRIQIRGKIEDGNIVVEVEDECGGLTDETVDLFKPFEQQNENRKGLGLGLTIAQRAIVLSNGTIGVKNLPKKGCIFKISLPNKVLDQLPIQ